MKSYDMVNCSFKTLCQDTGFVPEKVKWNIINYTKNITYDNDTIIFVNRNVRYVDDYNHKIKIALLTEHRNMYHKLYFFCHENIDKFDFIFTLHKSLLSVNNKYKYFRISTTSINYKEMKIYSKSKLISTFITSKKTSKGHKLRHDILQLYSANKINLEIDWYGRNNIEIKDNKKTIYVKNKIDGLKEYYFHLTIENEQIDGYTSEKLIDCFVTGCIPIYWGSPKEDLENNFDIRGIIIVNNIDEIVSVLENLTIKDYKDRYEYVIKNYNNVVNNKMYMVDDKIADDILKLTKN